jgi:hypothetical protein
VPRKHNVYIIEFSNIIFDAYSDSLALLILDLAKPGPSYSFLRLWALKAGLRPEKIKEAQLKTKYGLIF